MAEAAFIRDVVTEEDGATTGERRRGHQPGDRPALVDVRRFEFGHHLAALDRKMVAADQRLQRPNDIAFKVRPLPEVDGERQAFVLEQEAGMRGDEVPHSGTDAVHQVRRNDVAREIREAQLRAVHARRRQDERREDPVEIRQGATADEGHRAAAAHRHGGKTRPHRRIGSDIGGKPADRKQGSVDVEEQCDWLGAEHVCEVPRLDESPTQVGVGLLRHDPVSLDEAKRARKTRVPAACEFLMDHLETCDAIVAASRCLVKAGLNQSASGNISVRIGDDLLITPSGIVPDDLSAAMICRMPIRGAEGDWSGSHRPSSEWRLHRDVARARADVRAIVHTHAPHATALSMVGTAIPAAHYMIAAFGGASVSCTPYAPFGSAALADLVVAGLGDRHGVLLGNHGMLVTGADLAQAMWRAQELETLARLYILALAAGTPAILSAAEVADAIERFKNYGPVAPA